MNSATALSVAVTSLLYASQPVHAAAVKDYFYLTPEQLVSAEVVSATKKPQPVAQAPAAVYVITQEDLERTSVTSIADTLRMAPGVDVAQGDSNSWAINIRGFNKGLANQLLVMIDGRTLYNPLFAGTYWELQNLPLDLCAQVMNFLEDCSNCTCDASGAHVFGPIRADTREMRAE